MSEAPEGYDAVVEEYRKTALIKSTQEYEELYRRSVEAPEQFWAEKARECLSWQKEWDSVLSYDMDDARIEWFKGGVLNASYNCVDRHAAERPQRAAFHWEGDDPDQSQTVTYEELLKRVNTAAAALRARGVARGDRVVLYMPMIVELPAAMLACARIGAVHCVVYPGYSAESLAYRIKDCQPKAVITSNSALVMGERVEPTQAVNSAIQGVPSVETVLVVNRSEDPSELTDPRAAWWHDVTADPALPVEIAPEPMGSEDPLFIVYASGGVGKPKGLVHTHGGFLLSSALSTKLIFDTKDDETVWHYEDIGWITGHSYGVYGPLLNGLTSVLFEGESRPEGVGRLLSIISKYKVTVFSTVPSTIQYSLSTEPINGPRPDPSSLRLLAVTEESASESTVNRFFDIIGRKRCPVVNAYCQSESGGHIIGSLPGMEAVPPGSCARPFLGVEPVILDPDTGDEVRYPDQAGILCVSKPWPGIAGTVYGDHERFLESYFNRVPGLIFTGDAAKRDQDGRYWIKGRIDDVLNSSGRRLGIPELESAIMGHEGVAEAAVVGFPHTRKGQGIYAFVHLADGVPKTDALKNEVAGLVCDTIGRFAEIDLIQWVDTLPRTPSGKILRAILQKIAAGKFDDLGDVGIIADAGLIESLIKGRKELLQS